MRTASITAENVSRLLLPELDRMTGHSGAWRVRGPVASGTEAAVFRASSEVDGRVVAVKVYRPGFDDRARLQHRFALHCGTYDWMRMNCAGFDVPEPVALLHDHAAMVMEWVAEPALTRLLGLSTPLRPERDRALASAGRWLRYFHAREEQGRRPLRALKDLQVVRVRWRQRSVDGGNADDGMTALGRRFQDVQDRLEAEAARLDDERVKSAMLHGDFTPRNVLHGPTRTVGIDLGRGNRGNALHDVCRFLVRLEGDPLRGTLSRDMGPLAVHRLDQAAFMRGYLLPGETVCMRVLLYSQLLAIVRRWMILASGSATIAERLQRPLRLRRIRRMATHVVREMERL